MSNPDLPLFYSAPEPLSAQRHGDWRLLEGDFAFAAETPFVPLAATEIAVAARDYPVVFAGDGGSPITVLGLDRRNLFVDAAGRWDAAAYVPAYVRRYPFAFMAVEEPEGLLLAIDAAAGRIVREGEAGSALFEGEAPSALTRQAMEFCAAFDRDARETVRFAEALRAKALLIDQRADVALPDGSTLGVTGFQVVDRDKFAALDEETVLAWHRDGLLGLVHLHFASLTRFEALLARRAAGIEAAPPAGDSDARRPKKAKS